MIERWIELRADRDVEFVHAIPHVARARLNSGIVSGMHRRADPARTDGERTASPVARVVRVLAVTGIIASTIAIVDCGGRKRVDVTTCPPAPVDMNVFDGTCALAAPCTYAAPATRGRPNCNNLQCECVSGRFSCRSTSAYCPCELSLCPPEVKAGASCVLSTDRNPPFTDGHCGRSRNGLCAVPGPNASVDGGPADSLVCACDDPGPIWRCTPAR